MATKHLAEPYDEIDPHKAARLRGCAEIVAQERYANGTVKHRSSFCRVRLCPMCNWRRSQKVGGQMCAIMEAIKADKPCAYIFLTLTVRNCGGEMLDKEITSILRAFNNLTKLKAFKSAVLGYYRAFEVTHNLTDNTYHPHIHTILAVQPSYFKSRQYLSHEAWTEMWRSVLGVEYTPIVNVKKVKGDTAAAAAEVAKYAIKPEQYIIPEDWELTLETVQTLDAAFHNRRFMSYGGVFKEWHKRLHLSDADNPDDDIPREEPVEVTYYAWDNAYSQYRETDLR